MIRGQAVGSNDGTKFEPAYIGPKSNVRDEAKIDCQGLVKIGVQILWDLPAFW